MHLPTGSTDSSVSSPMRARRGERTLCEEEALFLFVRASSPKEVE